MSDLNIPAESDDDVDPNDPDSEEASSYNISPDPRAGEDSSLTGDTDGDPENPEGD